MTNRPRPQTISVSEHIAAFRDALVRLVPIADRLKIPWRDREAYDEWDAIGDALFRALVWGSIKYDLAEEGDQTFPLAPYDCMIDSYSELSFIEVLQLSATPPFLVFVGLSTRHDPFDAVRATWVDAQGRSMRRHVEDYECLPFTQAGFRLQCRERSGVLRPIDWVSLQ